MAEKLKVKAETVQAWETGKKLPVMNTAKEFAKKTHIPFGYLYLKKPPELTMPVADFRRGIGKKTTEDEVNLHDFIKDALHKKEWYEAYLKEMGTNYRSEHYQGKFSVHNSSSEIAEFIQNFLGIRPPADNNRRGRPYDLWSDLWKAAFHAGLWVMRAGTVGTSTHRTIPETTCRGFALKSEYRPVIWVNSRLSNAARSFTIIHELTHILLDAEGLSNFDSEDKEPTDNHDKLEKKCDEITANVLMPESIFSQIWTLEGDTLDRLNRVYKVFSVSKFALLRRAYDMQKISFAEYKDTQSVLVSQLVPKGKGGGNANINLLARNGWDFTNAVLSELMQGNISYPEAKGLLNVASHTRLDTLYNQLREGVYDISPRQ